MTPTLRKWHRFLWPLLTLVMFGLGILAVKALPELEQPLPEQAKIVSAQLLPASTEGPAAVQLNLAEALSAASILVYLTPKATDAPANGQLLGRVEGRGQYRLPLGAVAKAFPQKYLIGYDPIYNKQIFLIQLKD